MSEPLITSELVLLDVDLGPTKTDVIKAMAKTVGASGRADADGLAADALAREEKAVTGLGGGIAIPHCRSGAVTTNTLAFARLKPAVDFGAADGPADIAFMIAASEGSDDAHLTLLAKLARSLMRAEFLEGLRSATSPEQIVALVEKATAPDEAEQAAATAATAATAVAPVEAARVIVAVTACPTGIAHTFMAADGLEQAAKAAGVEIHVEPQGSGKVVPLDPAIIARASAAIFATDVGVRDKERFAGLPVIESGVKRAINEPAKLVAEALAAAANPNARKVAGTAMAPGAASEGAKLGLGTRIRQALMTGVSYMIPFVAAGGLLIALSFLLGGFDIALSPGIKGARTCEVLTWLSPEVCQAGVTGGKSIGALVLDTNSLLSMPAGLAMYLGAVLLAIGGAAFGFLVPALSGYIAYAIAGRPGIAPGFVGGAISVTLGAGFIGGLVTGLVAGALASWISGFKVPRWLAGLMPVVIIPLTVTFITGGLMYFLLGRPLALATKGLEAWLTGLSGGSAILLGILLGLMMCFDLGGPVNKAAYLFATAGLAIDNPSSLMVMATVMAAGMVPPLAMALATTVRKALFSEVELENGRAAWLLGAAFISEGAIPFAAVDPLRVIPAMMAGGAVTGALTMAFSVTSKAPHGGIFVLFAIDPIWGFLASLVAGTIVAAIAVIALKEMWPASKVEAVA